MKKFFALILTVLLVLSLSACSAESSSSSTVTFSTSVTDENGITTTNTSTGEVGVSVGTDGINTTANTTHETTTSVDSETIDSWYEAFSGGAIGTNEAGDRFLLAWDDPDPISYAALIIVETDGSVMIRNGEVEAEEVDGEEHLTLIDEEMQTETPFAFYESEEGDFDMFFFGDGDIAVMNYADQDTIINEMADVIAAVNAANAEN